MRASLDIDPYAHVHYTTFYTSSPQHQKYTITPIHQQYTTTTTTQSGILLGASLTITNLIDQLETPTRGALPATPTTSTCTVYAHPPCPVADSTMPSANGPTMNPSTTTSSPYYNAMAAHLKRIAGHHVRNAATLGGHFALCVARRLESDVATVLGGAEASLVMVDVLQAGDNTCPYVGCCGA